jgi:hypothetical protein
MATDQLALIVSVCSAILASLALGWNIYRDVVLKAKVVVSFSVVTILSEALPHKPQYLDITATNFGPGAVSLGTIIAADRPLWRRLLRKVRYAFIYPDYTNPLSARLPAKLETGDKLNLLLPFDEKCFLAHNYTSIGLSDFYDRTHWAPTSDLKKAYAKWLEKFPRET